MRQHYVTVVHKEANSDFRAYFSGLPWRCHHRANARRSHQKGRAGARPPRQGQIRSQASPFPSLGPESTLADPAYRTDVRALVPLELPEITTSARDRSRRYLGHRDRLHHRRHHENLGHGTSTSSGSPPSSSRSWRLRPSRSDRQPSIKLIVVHITGPAVALSSPKTRSAGSREQRRSPLSPPLRHKRGSERRSDARALRERKEQRLASGDGRAEQTGAAMGRAAARPRIAQGYGPPEAYYSPRQPWPQPFGEALSVQQHARAGLATD